MPEKEDSQTYKKSTDFVVGPIYIHVHIQVARGPKLVHLDSFVAFLESAFLSLLLKLLSLPICVGGLGAHTSLQTGKYFSVQNLKPKISVKTFKMY